MILLGGQSQIDLEKVRHSGNDKMTNSLRRITIIRNTSTNLSTNMRVGMKYPSI